MGIRVISGTVMHIYNEQEYIIDFDSPYVPDIPENDINDYRLKELLELYRLNAKAKINSDVLSDEDRMRYSELKKLYVAIYKEKIVLIDI